MARNLIIFAHGFLGFDKMLGIKYWNGAIEYVDKGLNKLDKTLAKVKATKVDPTGGTKVRAEGLAKQINKLLKSDPEIANIHIIAHSMGGLDARRLVTPCESKLDDKYTKEILKKNITITTVSTPHQGSPVADFGYCILGGKGSPTSSIPSQKQIGQLHTGLGLPIGWIKEVLANIEYLRKLFSFGWEGLKELTTWGVPDFEDASGVKYFSYGGKAWPGIKDGYDYLPGVSLLGWLLIYSKEGDNDGSVSLKSSNWGEYIDDIPADHAEQVGFQFSPFDVTFKYKEFYLEVARGLCEVGRPPRIQR